MERAFSIHAPAVMPHAIVGSEQGSCQHLEVMRRRGAQAIACATVNQRDAARVTGGGDRGGRLFQPAEIDLNAAACSTEPSTQHGNFCHPRALCAIILPPCAPHSPLPGRTARFGWRGVRRQTLSSDYPDLNNCSSQGRGKRWTGSRPTRPRSIIRRFPMARPLLTRNSAGASHSTLLQ